MDHTKRPRPNFEIPVAFGAYGDCQRPKTGPDLVDRDSGMDVLVGVNADDDERTQGPGYVKTKRRYLAISLKSRAPDFTGTSGRSVLGKKGRRLMVDSKGRIRRGRRCARCSETRTAGRNRVRWRRGTLRVRDIQAAKWKTDFRLGD